MPEGATRTREWAGSTADDDASQELSRYLPLLIRERLQAEWSDDAALATTTFDAAVLSIDISSYTSLTERAVRSGAEGVERFRSALNSYFCQLMTIVEDGGGDVFSFAGDAILAVFPAQDCTLSQALARAAHCALRAAPLRLDIAGLGLADDDAPVPSRTKIASGRLVLAAFGRAGGKRHILACGTALERLAAGGATLAPGSIGVDEDSAAVLGPAAELSLPPGSVRKDVRLLTRVCPPDDTPAPLHAAGRLPQSRVAPFLSVALAERIAHHQASWLAEMRFVCPVYVSLTPSRGWTMDLGEIARAVLDVEDVLVRLGGELLQVRQDDDKIVMIGAFGTPGCTHEDDAARAGRAACEVPAAVGSGPFRVSVGMASGSSLCGVYGHEQRQDYNVLGDVMNLAARLMQRQDGVLCDRETARLSGGALVWTDAGSMALKGFRAVVPVVRLEDWRDTWEDAWEPSTAAPPRLVGRTHEQLHVRAWLDRFGSAPVDRHAPLLIDGEAGMGKSTLAQVAVRRAEEVGIPVTLVAGSRIERLTPYYVWRSVLRTLFGQPAAGPERLADAVLRSLAKAPALHPFAPLLCDILPLPIAQTDVTRQMDPRARAAMTAQLLLHLLQDTSGPRLLVVEDAHWIDSASWSVIAMAELHVRGLLLMLTVRPEAMPLPREAAEFVERHRAQGLQLGGLSEAEIAELVAVRLGTQDVTPEISRFIRERSGGNPFFAEELALALRERGHLGIEGAARLTASALGKHALLDLPETVRAAVLERVDRLSARQQLLLKVASVIGAVAPMKALSEIFKTLGDGDALADELTAIRGRLLAELDHRDGEAFLCFRHAITQESAYSLLTPSQRRSLHRDVALWYEKEYAARTESWLPVLAHHFRAANESGKALNYLQRAGEHALQAHANSEAAQFLDAAIGLEPKLQVAPEDCARRRRLLAEAQLKLSQLVVCRQYLSEALALAGKPLPRTVPGLVLDIGTALLGMRPRVTSSGADGILAAQLHQLRAEVAYFEHDTLALLHGTFAGLREAMTGAPSRELACAHGTAAIVLGLLRLHRRSHRHVCAALEVAVAADHAPTAAYVQHLACVAASAVGDWSRAERHIQLAADGYRHVGDQYRWVTTRMILAYQALLCGRFDRIDAHLGEVDAASIFPAGPVQLRAWYQTVQLAACNARAATRGSLAPPSLLAQVQALAGIVDASQELLCRGFLADALLLRGDLDAARDQADLGLALLRRHQPTTYYSLFGMASIANTFVELLARGHGRSDALLESSRLAGRCLRRFALMVPIAKPCALLHDGRLRLVRGETRAGRRRLMSAARHAAGLDMVGVQAAAQRSLASVGGHTTRQVGDIAWA